MAYDSVLFLGNSITRHAPAPEMGWHGDWGMAASCRDNDYVHVLMRRIGQACPGVRFKAFNIAEWERNFWDSGINMEKLDEAREFHAELIVMRIGENVDDQQAEKLNFGRFYHQLIHRVNPSGAGLVVCTNSFWEKSCVNRQIISTAEEMKYRFVDIGGLSKSPQNTAAGLFEHRGVASHPSDRGMKAIAGFIWDAIEALI